MRHHRTRQLLALLATAFAVLFLGASPSAADVDCADLTTRDAAQSYFEGRSGDGDRLDSDADGQACEANDPHSYGSLSLPGLAVLVLGALVVNGLVARRQARPGTPRRPDTAQRPPIAAVTAPVGAPRIPAQRTGATAPTPGPRPAPAALEGSLEGLAHALRRVPVAKRISLVELYAVAHHLTASAVLEALAAEAHDIGLRHWAAAAGRGRQEQPRD